MMSPPSPQVGEVIAARLDIDDIDDGTVTVAQLTGGRLRQKQRRFQVGAHQVACAGVMLPKGVG
jgi:hypothetical protein